MALRAGFRRFCFGGRRSKGEVRRKDVFIRGVRPMNSQVFVGETVISKYLGMAPPMLRIRLDPRRFSNRVFRRRVIKIGFSWRFACLVLGETVISKYLGMAPPMPRIRLNSRRFQNRVARRRVTKIGIPTEMAKSLVEFSRKEGFSRFL